MTVVVTRNVALRIRGFLASCMCEVAPGTYTAPRMSPAVRDRVWDVMERWFHADEDASILMTWPDSKLVSGQALRVLGVPRTDLVEVDGIILARRHLTPF